jgi:hypothetical protein
VGSLENDASLAADVGKGDTRVQPVDVATAHVDGAGPDVPGIGKDGAFQMPDAAGPDTLGASKDVAYLLPEAAGLDAPGVGKDVAYLLPEALPDAPDMGKDGAAVSPDAGTHQCALNADGTCQAVTANTACTPFTGRRFDESASCISTTSTTLWCCATAAGDSCGWPAATGCLQVALDSGTATYWTPSLAGPAPAIAGGQACSQATSAKVSGAQICASPSPDAAADADPGEVLPSCQTDNDCCVTVDSCTATARLTGKANYGLSPVPDAGLGTCLSCIPPSVQVQCQGGFCVGTKLSGMYTPLIVSHCGYVPLTDAGAPVLAHAAGGDAGVPSHQTIWGCGH